MIAITGNTYPVREQLRSLGGKWDPIRKAWIVPDERAEEARQLVAGTAPRKTFRLRHGCTCPCCRPRCECEAWCVCRGGNIYDC